MGTNMGLSGIAVVILLACVVIVPVLMRPRPNFAGRAGRSFSSRKAWKAAEGGDPDAQYRLGMACLENGDGSEGFGWLLRSAQAGDARAQNAVGIMYETGEVIEQSDAEAAHWYLASANQGWEDAEVNAGYMYCLGRGVQKDYREALRWFERASRKGYAQGKNNLAWLLATCPDAQIRDGRAAALVLEPVVQGGKRHPALLDTLAAAYAEQGMFDDAIALVGKALEATDNDGHAELRQQMGLRLEAYRNRRAWREPPEPPEPIKVEPQDVQELPPEKPAPKPAVPRKKKPAQKKDAAKPAPQKPVKAPARRKAAAQKKRTSQSAPAAVADARAGDAVLRLAPVQAHAQRDEDRDTEYTPASWEDVAREFSAAVQAEEASAGEPIDDEAYDAHQRALDFSDSLVEAIIHERHAEVYQKMEQTYRDAIPESQVAPMLEQMYATYGGKPIEAELKADELGRKGHGKDRRLVHKFRYAVRTRQHKKGVYDLFVEVATQDDRMVCSSFFMAKIRPDAAGADTETAGN